MRGSSGGELIEYGFAQNVPYHRARNIINLLNIMAFLWFKVKPRPATYQGHQRYDTHR